MKRAGLILAAIGLLLGTQSTALAEPVKRAWKGQKIVDSLGYEGYRILSPVTVAVKTHMSITYDIACVPQDVVVSIHSMPLKKLLADGRDPPKSITLAPPASSNGGSIDIDVDFYESTASGWVVFKLYPDTSEAGIIINTLGKETTLTLDVWSGSDRHLADEALVVEGLHEAGEKIKMKCLEAI